MNKKVGEYLYLRKIGDGQFGVVYLAQHQGDESNLVAIKQISKKRLSEYGKIAIKLIRTELAIMAKLNHPNIIGLIQFIESLNNYYLVMPYCEGGDMEAFVKSRGSLPESEAIGFLLEIRNAFQEFYHHKIMHRDLKLANLFLKEGRVIVGDLGFANYGSEITTTMLGTRNTMAPELLFGTSDSFYTNKVDLWSIGVTFYEMLFGVSPFEWENEELINQIGLKEMIMQSSGCFLKFKSNIAISSCCKDLLIRLLQFNVTDRIGWTEFFKHPIFGQSVWRETKDYVDIHNISGHKIMNKRDQLNLKRNTKLVAEFKTLTRSMERDRIINPNKINKDDCLTVFLKSNRHESVSQSRYVHEQKLINSLIDAAKSLKLLDHVFNIFGVEYASMITSFTYILLFKKAILMIARVVESLKSKINIYEIADFKHFSNGQDADRLLSIYENQLNGSSHFFEHLKHRFFKQWSGIGVLSSIRLRSILQCNDISLINKELSVQLVFLKQFENHDQKLNSNRVEEFKALSKLEICIDCYSNIPFK
jgi:serine/threonine protein kinase